MINASMRSYDFFTLGTKGAYGQLTTPKIDDSPVGSIKMAISLTQQSIQDNINYKDAKYVGLTFGYVDDTYVIKYNDKTLLKVLYVNPDGRYNQVFMTTYD